MNARAKLEQPKANGYLPLSLGWLGGFHDFLVTGGPFDGYRKGDNTFGVCVRAERVPKGVDAHLPIHDFETPNDRAQVNRVLIATVDALLAGKRVYVGCMGGWGRTGLFLALLAKACGVADPVAYVRQYYSPRAVETDKQARYVKTFDVTELQRHVAWAGWTKRTLDTLFRWR
jgi:hypothetical protein